MSITDILPWKRNGKKVPVRYEAEYPLLDLRQEMDRLFEAFFNDPFALSRFDDFAAPWGRFSPQIDVSETDKAIIVSAELPGLDEDDIEVSLTRDALTISGEKEAEQEDKGKNYYRMERAYGAFRRRIPLPCEVEADQVEAHFKKGVLTITLPKTAAAQRARRKIVVKTR